MISSTRAAIVTTLVALASGLALNCGNSAIVGGDCRPGLSACDHECVNLGSDPNNCGACGKQCEATAQCLVGVCITTGPAVQGRPVDGGILLADGGLLLPDGAVIDPDGPLGGGGNGNGGSNGNGNGGSSASGGSGSGEECVPPLNTAAHCGACNTQCEAPEPYCAPQADTFACRAGCSDDLTLCGDRCVDSTTDIDHCGGCNQYCPTAICRDSICIGGTAGHVVAMCTNLQVYRPNAPQNLLLANAVFLAPNDPVRVLGYLEHASAPAVSGVERALTEVNDKNARDIQFTSSGSSAQVVQDLAAGSYDVLLVYDQQLAPSGALATLGQSWLSPLDSFTAAGGIVIVLSSDEGTGEMHQFIAQSGLIPGVSGQTGATGALLYNRERSDAVGFNVFGEFRALSSSCTYQIDAAPPDTAFVVTDAPSDSGTTGNPNVIHSARTSR